MSESGEESPKKKQGDAKKTFSRRTKTTPSVSATTSESTSQTSTEMCKSVEESRKQAFWRREKIEVHPAAITECSESSEETPQLVPMRLFAGSSQVKNLKGNTKTQSSGTEKRAERKVIRVKPAPTPPEMKSKGVKEAEAQVGLPDLNMISAMKAEMKDTTSHGQAKKTAANKEISNELNVTKAKATMDNVRPSSILPTITEEKKPKILLESLFQTSEISNVMEDGQNMKLHNQAWKEERKQMNPNYWENRMKKVIQDLNELAVSSDAQTKKSEPDSYEFSSNMMPKKKKRRSMKTHSNAKSESPDVSELNSVHFCIPLHQMIPGGLPNFGSSCYINASLQCLLTADAFCKELACLLDNSNQNRDDTFLRCFVELWRVRKGFQAQYGMDKLLIDLINSAADNNPEFTVNKQNDAHEFLCYCLTQIEESGRMQDLQEDGSPVKNNFSFKMRNIITCSSCGSQKKNEVEVFNHLSLPLVHHSVDECLYQTVNKTTEVERKCTRCGAEHASSSWMFHTLPRFLIIQLNRFKMHKCHIVLKLNNPMDIQPELQIGNCLPQSDTPRSKNNKAEAREKGRKNTSERETETVTDEVGPTSTYQLISVLSHVGLSAEYGHYLCDCSSGRPEEWITYNDHLVTAITEEDVLRYRSSDAYVLLYERLSTG
ncbi:ubiquitin carboxyl-terminal hydrolase 37-like isoform X2 [Tachysurus fulvidraco]|uniref:ubiquitin carboxyl-terminal hydrolase 37-like isoform X2 n=1 Tax=Tachysurus fulvidraco TaxID=1234273 RepID=UPI001FEF7A99|nr:ubiquitin carboxyl-terminal hydrolase 37-like isoform X2 [Tachysurus fulvidraco]